MLKREELIKIIEEYRLSHIQSEAEVRSKLIVSLIEWLGYPSQYRAEEFNVYGAAGGKLLDAKKADYLLFDSADFDKNNGKSSQQREWVKHHSLLVVEGKNLGKMPDDVFQPQFYTMWTKAVAYIIIDGLRIKGYLSANTTEDIPIIDCSITDLVDNEAILQFSYDIILNLKHTGIDKLTSLPLIQYKRKLSTMHGDSIPECGNTALISRHIVPIDYLVGDDSADSTELPFDRLKQEKYVDLLADAGYGKTYTLYQVYHEAEQQGYHPFFFHLRSLAEETVLTMIAQDRIDIDENAVFILDGLDEMPEPKKTYLYQAIDGIIALNYDVPIIISSRASTYSRHSDKMKLFTIRPITKQEIEEFLCQFDIDVVLWKQQVTERNLDQFCSNAFYLMELVNIWQSDRSLPNRSDLMKEIVDSRIKTDTSRIQDQAIILQQRLGETRKAFERIALIMQCIQRYFLTQNELDKLYDREFQKIMSCHGLWIADEDGSWSFAHNNFREYFAAVALSHMNLVQIKRFITGDSKCEYIRPSWNNVLSYLVSAYKKRDLQDWIYETQPTLITLFEKDRLDDNMLTEAIKRIMSLHKERNTWVDRNYSTLRKIASFCSTPGAVQYITDELQIEQTNRHRQNLLRCLAEFSSFYHLEEAVKNIVSNIAFNNAEEIQVRDDAFDVMRNHAEEFMEYIDKAARICMEETNEIIIHSILCFIQQAGKAEQYIDVVINAFDKYDYHSSDFISYEIIIDRILKDVQGLDAANRILSYLVDHKKKLHEDRNSKIFVLSCNVGMKYYDNENNCFLQTLLRLFDKYDALLSLDIYSSLANYIAYTHTESIFVNHIILHLPIYQCGFILSRLISDPMIDVIIKMIPDKIIDIRIIKDLISYLPYGDPKQAKLIQGLFAYTGEIIQISPPKDYARERETEYQRFFNSLFDEIRFDALVKELLMTLNDEAQMCEESIHTLIEKNEHHSNSALIACYFALQTYIPNNRGILIKDYKDYIKDWNTFCFMCAEDSIERHHVQMNVEQREFLVNFCIQYLNSTEFESIIKIKEKGISAPALLISATHIFKRLDVRVSEDLALKLLFIPSVFFDKDYYDQLPKCVITQITPENLRRQIIELVMTDKWNHYTADEYIRYCLEYHITECKEKVIQFTLNRTMNGGSTYWALEYLEKEFGLGAILSGVLPACNNDDLLSNLAARIPSKIYSSVLDYKLWNAYRNHHDTRWITYLLDRSNREALLAYYEQARELMTLPDMVPEPAVPEATEAIRKIESADCLSVLINLLQLSCDPNFKDREYFGLRDSCCNAIVAIGKTDYTITRNALSAAKTESKTTFDTVILDLIDAIEYELPYIIDKPMSFETAIQIIS